MKVWKKNKERIWKYSKDTVKASYAKPHRRRLLVTSVNFICKLAGTDAWVHLRKQTNKHPKKQQPKQTKKKSLQN